MKNLTAPSLALIAVVALFAGSGGAVAGTGKQIKDNTVTSKDIKNGSLQGADLSAKTVKRFAQGLVSVERVVNQLDVAATASAQVSAECPSGTRPISVTGHWVSSNRGVQAVLSASDPQQAVVYAVPRPSMTACGSS